ncbi:MAG: hypothetical protein D6677_08220 [Calditrichaeota bacterium]|nr:MAG: hypothetical protein D6677_08220 [Calditrichota bacterium]
MRFYVLLAVFAVLLSSCVGKRELTTEHPYSQASVVIHLKDGNQKKGIVLKKEKDTLIYVDADSHNKESVSYENIRELTEAPEIYDFEGYPIPRAEISAAKGWNSRLLYGGGGFVLGAAAGFGVGIGLVANGVEADPLISIVTLGLVSGIYFGYKGNEVDYEDAAFAVRKARYKKSKAKRDKAIEEAKRKLREQQRKKEELLRKIEEKKKQRK